MFVSFSFQAYRCCEDVKLPFSSPRLPLTHMDTHSLTHTHTHTLTMAAPSLVLHTPPSILPPLPSSPREALSLSLSLSLFLQISSPPHDKRSCQRSDQSGAAGWVINSQHSVISDWLSKSQTLEEQEFTTNTDIPAGAAPKTSANKYTEGKDPLNFLKVQL